MNKKNYEQIYEQIASKNGISVEEVKKEMQAAVDSMYTEPNDVAKEIKSKGEKPSVEEVIEHIARKVRE